MLKQYLILKNVGAEMREEWMKILPKLIDNLANPQEIQCPNCREYEVEYLYIGDEKTRIGYFQMWCNKCLKGIYVSRAKAPVNARFVTFDHDLNEILPKYEIDD